MLSRSALRLFSSGQRTMLSARPSALPRMSLPSKLPKLSVPQMNTAISAVRCPTTMRRVLSTWSSPLARRMFSTSNTPPNSPPSSPDKDPESKKNDKDRSLAINIIALIVFVFGVSYLMVPLYRIFCTMTGVAGDVQIKNQTLLDEIEAKRISGYRPKRRFTVEFAAATAKDLPWSFVPLQKQIEVYPGDTALAFYMAKNETSAPITGVATYNVNPLKAGLYFNKIQCFCFEEQQLQPYEEIEMPVFFFIDPEVENDARFADVDKIILSYTFFPIEYGDTDEQRAAHAAFVSSLELQKPQPAATTESS